MNIEKEYQKNAETQVNSNKVVKKKRRTREQLRDKTREDFSLSHDRRSPAYRKRKMEREIAARIEVSSRNYQDFSSLYSFPPVTIQEPSKDSYIYINLETKIVDRLYTKKILTSENILDESEPQFFIKSKNLTQENVLRRKVPLHLQSIPILYGQSPGDGYDQLKKLHKEGRQRFKTWRKFMKHDEDSQPKYDTITAKPSLKLEAYKPYKHKNIEFDLLEEATNWDHVLANPDPGFAALMGSDLQQVSTKTAIGALRRRQSIAQEQ